MDIKNIVKITLINILIFSVISLVVSGSLLFFASVALGGIVILLDFFLINLNYRRIFDPENIRNRNAIFLTQFTYILRIGVVLAILIAAVKFFKINLLGAIIGITSLPLAIVISRMKMKKDQKP